MFILDAPDIIGPINERLVVNISDSASLACNFDGNPLPKVTWRKNADDVIMTSSRIRQNEAGFLEILDVKQEDAGRYVCVGESELGIAENTVNLVVPGPPIITSNTGTCSKKI